MHEDLLHFVWKYRKLPSGGLSTTCGKRIRILHNGLHNAHSGPDFFNAKLEIDGQLWAGNVEIHVKASDWYLHGHQNDLNYTNVILHVVWEEDTPVIEASGAALPALQLKSYIPENLIRTYRRLMSRKRARFINCESEIKRIDGFHISHWLERLYIERLEGRASEIEGLLNQTMNNWEHVLFVLLLKNFGLNINGAAFFELGKALDFKVILKLAGDVFRLESLLFGQAGLLRQERNQDGYYRALQQEYSFQRKLYALKAAPSRKPEYAKLRPPNFPGLRLAQFAALYCYGKGLFARAMAASTLKELCDLFSHSASAYWDTHYDFGKPSSYSVKKLARPFIHLLLINTIFPVRFAYARHRGSDSYDGELRLSTGIPFEKNRVVSGFGKLGISVSNARESQALLQLYGEYCTNNRCLQCAIGCRILKGK